MMTLQVLAAPAVVTAAPFWQTVITGAAIGAFVSALVGATTTLLTGRLESRREHRRWLREKRLDAYTRAFALTKGFDLNQGKTNKVVRRLLEEGVSAEPAPPDAELIDTVLSNPEYVELDAEASRFHASAAAELAAVVLLGPDEVSVAVLAMQQAYEAEDDDAAGRAEVAFRDAARRVLRVDR
jgi:hypothetical protein